jgi:flagellar hook-basal body complex protein FliE
MAMPLNAAATAYSNAAKLISNGVSAPAKTSMEPGQGNDFASLLADNLQSVVDAGRRSDALAMDMVNGKANVVDVVTAVSNTEIMVEGMVAVRDRVISAYEEIMRMPI